MRAVPDYHPEFGLLCPSPRRRRGMRLAALCIVTTMAIGATMGLAVARWPASGDGRRPRQSRRCIPAGAGLRSRRRRAPGHGSCKPDKVDTFKDLLALFLEPVCGLEQAHARHGARAANRVANVIIGRTDARARTDRAGDRDRADRGQGRGCGKIGECGRGCGRADQVARKSQSQGERSGRAQPMAMSSAARMMPESVRNSESRILRPLPQPVSRHRRGNPASSSRSAVPGDAAQPLARRATAGPDHRCRS